MKKKICRIIPAAILVVILSTFVAAQKIETGFLNRSVTTNGSQYRYVVYVSREFNRSKMWPVIVQLHGGGVYGNDGLKHTEGGFPNDPSFLAELGDYEKAIEAVVKQAEKGFFWQFLNRTDSFLDPIRDDPRFKEAMKKLDPPQ